MKTFSNLWRRSHERLIFVELEQDTVQLLVVDSRQKRREIVLLDEADLHFQDTKALAAWLQEAVEARLGGVADTAYFVYVNNEDGLRELLRLPQIRGKQLQEAMQWELPQYVSWSEGAYVYDYRVLASTADDYSSVELVAAHRGCFTYLKELQEALPWQQLGLTVSDREVGTHSLTFVACTYSEEEMALYNQQFASILYQADVYLKQGRPLLLKEKQGLFYSDYFVPACVGLGVLILIGVLGFTGKLYYNNYLLAGRLSQVEQKLQSLAPWDKQRQEGLALEAKLKAVRSKLPATRDKVLCPEQVLAGVTRSLAADSWLDRLVIDNGQQLTVQGRTLHAESVQQLLGAVEKQQGISKLQLKEFQQLKGNVLGFTLSNGKEVSYEYK